MAYSELIKNFEKIREYVAQFYVYGFKTRNEYNKKSARSYDNERRRIESWLGDYMKFNQDASGKSTFLAVDSRTIAHNPLFNAFKAKSFTNNDITLHFYILDILADGEYKSLKEIINIITDEYLSMFESAHELDESTIRKKLKEYEKLGLIKTERLGKELFFARNDDNIDLESWREAISFFSEEDSIGVVGSYLLDKFDDNSELFCFKHHYILHALESEILEDIFIAIKEHRSVELDVYISRYDDFRKHTILPLKIYSSTQNGRRYVLGYHYDINRMFFSRLDNIKKVTILEENTEYDLYLQKYESFKSKPWGVSTNRSFALDHIEMTVFVDENEEYILHRLEREKRYGKIEKVDDKHYKFVADVCSAMEMMPWIRTYICRITNLECSDKEVVDTFKRDIRAMAKMYGGDGNAF